MFVTRKRLSRRSMLKGMGAAISLPFLEAMTPAFAQGKLAGEAPVRLAWFYLPNGIDMRNWTPEDEVQRSAKEGTVIDPGIEKPFGVPPEFPDYFRLMTDLMFIAFKADITRISTIMIGREGSVRPYPEIGIGDGHHPLTHHFGNMEMLDKVRQINTLHAKLFSGFLQKMKSAKEGDSNLLDRSLIVFGSGLSDGNVHAHDELPTVLAGRGGGFVSPGRHIIYQRETPVTNLFAAMIERVGVRPEHVGDSTGRLGGLSLG